MKKFFVSLMVLFLLSVMAMVARADVNGTYWNLGGIEFVYPLANVDATLYYKSITTGDEMVGAQTMLMTYPATDVKILTINIPAECLKASFGGITSTKANGMPYVSLGVNVLKITSMSGNSITTISTGYGHDFKENVNHFLIGCNVKLW